MIDGGRDGEAEGVAEKFEIAPCVTFSTSEVCPNQRKLLRVHIWGNVWLMVTEFG